MQKKSIRPFIGAKDYDLSIQFYEQIGFIKTDISHNMCVFELDNIAFYLQKAYVKDWIDNTMVFIEVDNVELFWEKLNDLHLPNTYNQVKLSSIQYLDWGKEFFLHDPSGILWHIGAFN
jgi:hypothetical protein